MRAFFITIETWVSAALLLTGITFLIRAQTLPVSSFDSLGPGGAPKTVAAVLVMLCAIVLARACYRSVTGAGEISGETPVNVAKTKAQPTPGSFVLFFLILFAYILAFQLELAHFVVITSVFVLAATMALRGLDRKAALIAAVSGVVFSVFLFVILTRFFVIRLPGAF